MSKSGDYAAKIGSYVFKIGIYNFKKWNLKCQKILFKFYEMDPSLRVVVLGWKLFIDLG